MKPKKSKWRKINGKWINLEELSKNSGKPKYIKCDEYSQIYTYGRTNKKASYKPDYLK